MKRLHGSVWPWQVSTSNETISITLTIQAKDLDPRINIAGGLEAIRRARRPDLSPVATAKESEFEKRFATLAGDLSAISVFDAVQVIENAKLTGVLELTGEILTGRVLFNEGRIVDADCGDSKGEAGFRQ
ncbi:MAG: DUF4388 domain-containing protein, partial [Pyrinomonadaceae bacterium]